MDLRLIAVMRCSAAVEATASVKLHADSLQPVAHGHRHSVTSGDQ